MDNLTGLMWAKDASLAGGTWQGVLNYVKSLNSGAGLGGYHDWRLPDLKELYSLIDHSKYNPALPADHPFDYVQSNYWSSTSHASGGSYGAERAWYIDMRYGGVNNHLKSQGFSIWPVRSTTPIPSYTVTVTVSIAGDPVGGSVFPLSQTVSYGAPATFTVTTNTGYKATVYEGTLSGDTWTIPYVTSSHAATVTFNLIPVALCRNVTVSADSACTANASIDNGSYDPIGDSITFVQSPPGPYPIGSTNVVLTVFDSGGASSLCSGTVTVIDDRPPITRNIAISPNPAPVNTPIVLTATLDDSSSGGVHLHMLNIVWMEAPHGMLCQLRMALLTALLEIFQQQSGHFLPVEHTRHVSEEQMLMVILEKRRVWYFVLVEIRF